MTTRGTTVAAASVLLLAVGLMLRWPEATGLGAAGLSVVVLALVLTARRPVATVTVADRHLQVPRGQHAEVDVQVSIDRVGSWSRLVDGPEAAPRISLALSAGGAGAPQLLQVPVDTSARGRWPLGPFAVVHGDPCGIVRRVVASGQSGTLTVQPRVHPTGRSLSRSLRDDGAGGAGQPGADHFHALRDYVLGDAPRSVHWRSSARAGRLVVRQELASTSSGTLLVLDVDRSAYTRGGAFTATFDTERFELAVDVVASLLASESSSSEQIHVVTTRSDGRSTSAPGGSVGPLLDALAVVQPVGAVETAPEEVVALQRRLRCARTVVVTGLPGSRLQAAVTALAAATPVTRLVRVGAGQPGRRSALGRAQVVDVQCADDLVAL